MVRNFAYLSLYMPSSLDEKQCRCRLPVCRSPRSLFGHWLPDLRSWDFWKFGRQISPTKPYPTYPSMYIDRTHLLRYRWCIILKYQELSWVYITNCWMLFLSNELCSTGSMLLWRYVHSCRIWDFFQCIERFVSQWGHLLKTPSIKVLVDMVTWEADFDVNVGLLGSIMVVWSEFAGKVEDENLIGESDIQTTEPSTFFGAAWAGAPAMAAANVKWQVQMLPQSSQASNIESSTVRTCDCTWVVG